VFNPSALLDLWVLMLVSLATVPLALALRKVKLGRAAPLGPLSGGDKESTHEYSWNVHAMRC
jgi:hypothetical protein